MAGGLYQGTVTAAARTQLVVGGSAYPATSFAAQLHAPRLAISAWPGNPVRPPRLQIPPRVEAQISRNDSGEITISAHAPADGLRGFALVLGERLVLPEDLTDA